MLTDHDYPILTPATLKKITGYQQPAKQLAELKEQGFYRARINRLGVLVLERAHYEAVCAGQVGIGKKGCNQAEPKLASEMT